MEAVRLGIVGTGRIAKRAVKELAFVSDVEFCAVFNPNLEHTRSFLEETGAVGLEKGLGDGAGRCLESGPVAAADFDEFLGLIDAVYVASPHGTHYVFQRIQQK